MKKICKVSLFILGIFLIAFLGIIFSYFLMTFNYNLNPKLLVSAEKQIEILDDNNEVYSTITNGSKFIEIDKLSNETINAFIAIEDKRFNKHNGIDYLGLLRATFKNLTTFSFKEGGSTISQQLIKNTHLTNEKTIKRKLIEIKLATKLEKKYSKKEILEKYLNTIYFGNNCYGIESASNFYFDKSASDLSIGESAMLAGLIKSPYNYSPKSNNEKSEERKSVVLKAMYEQKFINNDQYQTAKNKKEIISEKYETNIKDYNYLVNKEINEKISLNPYITEKIKVYTRLDKNLQTILEKNLNNDEILCDKTAVVFGKENNIIAYLSTCGELNRQVGSIIKPILVYAPAIEENLIYPCSIIKDEKININGYSPKNYNDKYYGNVSARFALSNSLNVPTVKIFNSLGIEKGLNYLNKLGIKTCEEDKNLSIALGSLYNGESITNITASYGIFNNDGYYYSPSVIKEIKSEDGKLLYKNSQTKNKIISSGTVSLVNEMLNNCVLEGTSKKLKYTNIDLCAKTGTVGNKSGNTDAYSVSYNNDYLVGIWYGNKNNDFLDNSVTGASFPTILSGKIWEKAYKNKPSPKLDFNKDTVLLKIDTEEYKEGNIYLAEYLTDNINVKKEIFKKDNHPLINAKENVIPNVKNFNLSINNNEINLKLCLTKYTNAIIFRENKNKKVEVYLAKEIENEFIDKNVKSDTEYSYYALPYVEINGEKKYGKEIFLGKIKSPKNNLGDFWLNDNL